MLDLALQKNINRILCIVKEDKQNERAQEGIKTSRKVNE
jgi:hypothetical protein